MASGCLVSPQTAHRPDAAALPCCPSPPPPQLAPFGEHLAWGRSPLPSGRTVHHQRGREADGAHVVGCQAGVVPAVAGLQGVDEKRAPIQQLSTWHSVLHLHRVLPPEDGWRGGPCVGAWRWGKCSGRRWVPHLPPVPGNVRAAWGNQWCPTAPAPSPPCATQEPGARSWAEPRDRRTGA